MFLTHGTVTEAEIAGPLQTRTQHERAYKSLYSRSSRVFQKGPRQLKPTSIDVFSDADSESPP